jgi:hypothetical protein
VALITVDSPSTAAVGNTINSVRRYYLLERIRARADLSPTEPAWQYKQEHEAGTPLPATFPLVTRLAVPGYVTYADLNGADLAELRTNCGFTPREAQTVLDELTEHGNPDAAQPPITTPSP